MRDDIKSLRRLRTFIHPYPHIKLTREKFSRLLATRKLAPDNAEYFGAFLNRTTVRIMLNILNRTFRLRTCEIEIDGSFPVPCTQYYAGRCLGPCVSEICPPETYLERVELARLFLANRRDYFSDTLTSKIAAASDALNFERAASLNLISKSVEKFWGNVRMRPWLDDAFDTLAVSEADRGFEIILVTQRRQKILGKSVFYIDRDSTSFDEAFYDLLLALYRYYAPREVRVNRDFAGRIDLSHRLAARFERSAVAIRVCDPGTTAVATARTLTKTYGELEITRQTPPATVAEIRRILSVDFKMGKSPARAEAYDVAHISGTRFVASRIAKRVGDHRIDDFGYLQSNESGELSALGDFIERRFSRNTRRGLPDLILIDGGRTQLNAALKAIEAAGARPPKLIGAVKPPRRHSSISHFLSDDGHRVRFDADNPAHRFLLNLRDDAHELANGVHRLSRDMSMFYELAAILPSVAEPARQKLLAGAGSIRRLLSMSEKDAARLVGGDAAQRFADDISQYDRRTLGLVQPLIVPIRYVEPNGHADDLRLIEAR